MKHTTSTHCWYRFGRQAGATFLEFAITVPIVFGTIFTIIDFSRYLSTRGMISSVVNEIATQATTIPNLDKDPITADRENPLVVSAKNSLINNLKNSPLLKKVLPSNTTYSQSGKAPIEINIPRGPNRKDAMLKEPIEVVVRAKFDFFTPFFPSKTIEVRALTYREVGITPSSPVAVDCRGFPLVEDINPICPCMIRPGDPSAPIISDPTRTGQNPLTGCGCLGNLVDRNPNPSILDCQCPDPSMVFDATQQKCLCGTSGNYQCPLGQSFNANTCRCEGHACNIHQILNSANQCVCNPASYVPGEAFWMPSFRVCVEQGTGFQNWNRCDCADVPCPAQINSWTGKCGSCNAVDSCINAEGLPCEGNGGFFHYTDSTAGKPTNLCLCKIDDQYYQGDDTYEIPKMNQKCFERGKKFNPATCSCESCSAGQVVDPYSLGGTRGSWCHCGDSAMIEGCWNSGLRYKSDCSGCDNACGAGTQLSIAYNACLCSEQFIADCAAQGKTLVTSYGNPAYSCACSANACNPAQKPAEVPANSSNPSLPRLTTSSTACVCKYTNNSSGGATACQAEGYQIFDASNCRCANCPANSTPNAAQTACVCPNTCPAGFAQRGPVAGTAPACSCYCAFSANQQPVNGTCPPSAECTPLAGGGWDCGGGEGGLEDS